MGKQLMTIFATAVLASSLFSVAAVASNGDHRSFGGDRVQEIRPRYSFFARHGGHYRSDAHERNLNCHTPDEISKYPPWPPYCS